VFHTDCIVQWLQIANTCPTCRHKVEEEANPAHADNYVDPVYEDDCAGGCRGTCLCDDEIEGDATRSEMMDSETVALHAALDQIAGSSPRRGPKMKRPQVSLNRRGLHARGKKAQIGIAATPTGGDAPLSPRAADASSVFETEFSPRNKPGGSLSADEAMDAATADQRALEAALERSKVGDGKAVPEEWEEDWIDDDTESSPAIPPAPPLPPFASMFNKRVGESPRSVSVTGANAAPRVPSGTKIGKEVALMFQQVQAELQVSAAMDGMFAVTIQAAYRGWAARKFLAQQHTAATCIQAHARGVICRTAERNAGIEAWNLGAVSLDDEASAHEFLDDDSRHLGLDLLDVDRNSGSAVDNYSPARRDDFERMGSFSSDCSAGTSMSSGSDASLDLGHFEGYASTVHAPPRLNLDLHLDVELATELAIAATAPPSSAVPLACDGPCDELGMSPAAVAPPPIGMSAESPMALMTPVTPQSPGIDALLSAPVGTQDPRIHTRKFSESQLAELRRHTGRKLRSAVPSAFGGKVRLDEPAVEVVEQTGGASGIPDLLPILEIEAQLATSAFTAPKKKGLLRRLAPGKPGKKGRSKQTGPRERELAPQSPPPVAARPGSVPRGGTAPARGAAPSPVAASRSTPSPHNA